jgi:hypothetical protein
MKLNALLSASLLSAMFLSACGTGTVTVSGVSPERVRSGAQVQAAAQPAKTELKTDAIEGIKLAPVSEETVKQQASLRKAPKIKSETRKVDDGEMAQIRQLIADAESKIAAEDALYAKSDKGGFSTKSAGHGEDVDIELFLYHPKYGEKAKSWGIDNAAEFLEAGKSPWRRFTLKLKLEGLFAPKGFSQQLLFWIEQADLLRVSGISKDQAWLLVANGITSVPDLARRNPIELTTMIVSIKLMAFQYGMDAPSVSELIDWSEEARTLQPAIY